VPEVTQQLKTALADRYVIERELGAGGMATVYLAHDVKHERKVALKVLRPELAAVIGAERFLAEIKVTANLQHPHILPLHDSGEAESFLYYVMPYVEGETLRDKIEREKQLRVNEAVEISRSVAAALDYAHRHEVVHRDIKPENILMHDGQAMVADFGIALAVSHAGGQRLTETGLSVGTPHYMSPEQAMGDRELDARSDVYSLGAMLYEMLVGEPPYTGPTAQAIVAKVITEKAPPVTVARPTAPPHVAASIDKSLQKLPADRFSSASEFASALANPAFSVAATAAAPAAATAGERPRWSRTTIGLVAVSAVLLAAAAWGWLRPGPEAPPVSRQRISLASDIPSGWIFFGAAVAPDGSALVYVDTAGGSQRLWVKERDQAHAVPLSGTVGGRSPFFSLDGEWVAFVTNEGLHKVPRRGGSPIMLSDSGGGFAGAGAWLDDGTMVFFGPANDLVYRASDAGGVSERILEFDDIQRGFVRATALPGGRGVLFIGCTSFPCIESEAWVLDLRTLEPRILVEQVGGAWYVPTGHLVYVRRDGGVFVAPFDLGTMEISGPAIPAFDGVRTLQGLADMQVGTNGTVLYVAGEAMASTAVSEVVWVDRTGNESRIDPNWPIRVVANGGLSLSPDGTQLAVNTISEGGAETHVFVKRLPDGPASRLTFEGGQNIRPTWSPDGRHLLWVSNRSAKMEVWRKRADGSQGAELLVSVQRSVFEGMISPDGEWIIYRTDDVAAGSGDILARRVTGDTSEVELIATVFEETSPNLSPDGRWMAYSSNESGHKEVYVRPFPNVHDGRWQVSVNGGTEPLWAHSGRELFYWSRDGEMVAAQVETDPTFRVGTRQVLFQDPALVYMKNDDHRHYSVSLDDRRFLVSRPVEVAQVTSEGELILIENWLEELKQRVRN
jgi:serine/threonine-protein kinase